MRRPGAILLISCYELGHQPIGIAQPIAFLEQAGYLPAGLDIAVQNLDTQCIRRATFVGISVPMHTALRLGVRIAELVRTANASCHICFYGLYASINAKYLLSEVADSVVGGEYEVPLVSLIRALENGQAIEEIAGISSRGRIVGPYLKKMITPAPIGASQTVAGSGIPFPVSNRRHLPALDKYARLDENGAQRLVGYVEASRGCLHHCLHCPIVPVYEGRLFLIPKEAVLEDIRRQVDAGATHITFGDPDFFNGPGHSMEILRSMHAEFPRLTFDFTAKIEHLLKRQALLKELRALGCLFVISAVESFSDHVLERLAKGHTGADVVTAIGLLREAGIALRPSLVAFTPWTTLEDYLFMLSMVETHDLIDATDAVQFSIRLLIPPGSALLGTPHIPPLLGSLDQARFQYPWKHPDERMDQVHHAVLAIVEAAAEDERNSIETFDRILVAAYEMAGCRADSVPRAMSPRLARPKPPRLTEAWFCCAEPTAGQFKPLQINGEGEV
ncbi:MAG: CUAEP/CCAEP-tail radical SAM protein [Nitrospiraceae bacterium]